MSRRLVALSAGLLAVVLIAPPAQARAGTFRVSITGRGGQGNNNSFAPSISFNGRFVAFESFANNLVKNPDTNGVEDVFGHDNGNGNRCASV